jgi:hypothetical protein
MSAASSLSKVMPSHAKDNFDANRADIDQLWAIHEDYAGEGAGRKYGVEVLNRAAIVFITALWESFVEDLADEAFLFLLQNAPTADGVPSKVRDAATRAIFDQKDSRKVWDLADAGWRTVLMSHKGEALGRWLGDFNTPKTDRVNQLYRELLGLVGLSKSWSWKGMSAEQAAAKLDEYIEIRGEIAHDARHDTAVYKSWSEDYFGHVSRIVERCDSRVAEHLHNVTGKVPW